MQIRNSYALVTGASSGIGEATAHALAAAGALPILVARRQEELQRVAADIEAAWGKKCLVLPADVTSKEDRQLILEHVQQEIGALDILINNAGVTAHCRFDESNALVLEKTMQINFFAATELTRLLLPLLKERTEHASGERAIVLVSTPSGLYGIPGRFAYSASKAAGHAWMESMRLELREDRIHCLIVCPGYTRTALRATGLGGDGKVHPEKPARGARSAEYMAQKILQALRKNRRLTLTDRNGRLVYWLRTLAPGLLERLMAHKLKKDFQKK